MAKQLGVKYSIARVRNPDYLKQRRFMRDQLGISMIINPELEAANEIRRILMFPSAFQVDSFVGGRIEMAEFRLKKQTKLNQLPIHSLSTVSKTNILVCAVQREKEIIVPDGKLILQEGDRIYVTGMHRDLVKFCQDINLFEQKTTKVIIVGGGRISFYLAKQLIEQGIQVKIIENNPQRCIELSEKLPEATIIEADGSEEEVLLEEGIQKVDALISLTGLDEENIVLSLYGKNMKVKKTVAKITRMNFSGILSQIEIDSIISPKEIIATHILRYVRAKNNKDEETSVKTLHKFINNELEAMEFVVTETSQLLNKKIMDLELKQNILFAGISRGNNLVIPNGSTVINLHDHVIILTIKDHRIGNLNDILLKRF